MPNPPPTPKKKYKVCTSCKKRYTATSVNFPVKNKKLQPVCRKCTYGDAKNERVKKLKEQTARRKEEKEQSKINKKVRREKAQKAIYNKRQKKQEDLKKSAVDEEYANRLLARRRLLPFVKRFHPSYDAGWVHKVICYKLERFSKAVANRESPRLMLFMPPRGGKSELASDKFPSWHLGQYPDHEIIAASYAVGLPEKFSRAVKSRMKTASYRAVFPHATLDPEAQAIAGWLTTKGGGYVPAGVGTGIAGKGAHILIIDDPVADAAEADSESQRQTVWDWWDAAAETRLAPGGGVLIIQTRWHDDDLSGRLLRKMHEALADIARETAEVEEAFKLGKMSQEIYAKEKRRLKLWDEEVTRWDVMTFPAMAEEDEWMDTQHNIIPGHIAKTKMDAKIYDLALEKRKREVERGLTQRSMPPLKDTGGLALLRVKEEALHPARYDEMRYRRKRRGSQSRFWSAMYQQNPVPDEGAYYKQEYFRYEPEIPDYETMNIYAAWDLAIGQKQTNDWTVGIIAGHDEFDRIHILNMVRVRTDELAELIVNSVKPYAKQLQLVGLEQGQIQMSVAPSLKKEMERQRVFFALDDTLKPVTDKTARGKPAQARMQMGHVLWPANQPWVDVARAELLRFPGGLHDDICDALAWLIRMIERQQPPKPRKATKKEMKSWKKRLKQHTHNTSKTGAMAA